ncbi:MAG TPA: Nascent polypeptide-associated complex protein [Candidatus Thorarchaeota archaeon]|nr:MAG: Nascent polypeptide-associated complex protein [Candidatus Thorarchaeota archaeon]RLI62739.1 MAG: Nascent polypeptide-associated complex protein [Candidatus Thorarchaeota archaeon]HDD67392.1 Nascent polypeptide-associated complex protein [Candidatus Thorarchaeota archaeon]
MGFRGMSPKQIARMMKKMGIEQKDVPGVKEVIIRFSDKEWLISNPQVLMIKQAGSESFQIAGARTERRLTAEPTMAETEKEEEKTIEIPMEDAALVAGQASVSIEEAIEALRATDGDLAAAILRLRHK